MPPIQIPPSGTTAPGGHLSSIQNAENFSLARFRDEADKGFVFLFLNSNNPLWIPAILRSVAVQFSSAKFYLANNVAAIESLFHRRPVELDQLHAGPPTELPNSREQPRADEGRLSNAAWPDQPKDWMG